MQWHFQNRSILSLKKQLYLFNNGEFLISFLKPFLQFMKSSDHHSRQTYAVVVAWKRRGNEVSKYIHHFTNSVNIVTDEQCLIECSHGLELTEFSK